MTLDLVKERLYYSEDSPSGLLWKHNNTLAGTKSTNGYWKVTVNKKQMWAHRVVWFLCNSEWPEFYINHEDLDRGNNRINNLSKETHETNSQYRKMHKDNTSGVVGVSWIKTRGYLYANVFYREDGRPKNKRFSVLKYGAEEAWRLAVEFRVAKLQELNEQGSKYNLELYE